MTFEEFKARIQDGIKNGAIKLSDELNELDLAIQYVLFMEGKAKGTEHIKIDVYSMYAMIGKYCGDDARERMFAEIELAQK